MCPGWLRLAPDRKTFHVIPERAAVVVSIFEDCVAGIGAWAIARRLNARRVPPFRRAKGWHQRVVSSILANRAVLGEFQPGRRVDGRRVLEGDPIQNYFPSVASESLYFRAQDAINQRRRGAGRGGGRKGSINNIFSGISLTCSYCGGRVRFENKGRTKRGGSYLVCDRARRGLDCPATRWKYKDFETSFLTFCEEVDLESVIHTEDDARRRSNLEGTISALRGEQAALKEQMDRAFELLNMGTATRYVGEKLRTLEARHDAVEVELKGREQELARMGATRDLGTEELRSIMARVQAGTGDEAYKLRSMLQSRLRSLVTSVQLAPVGHTPLINKTLEFLRDQPDAQDVIQHLEQKLQSEEEARPYFAVGFKNGTTRAVFPNKDDPTRVYVQATSSPDEGLVLRYPDHDAQVFLPRFVASDLEPGEQE
jgi:hypothetical protein